MVKFSHSSLLFWSHISLSCAIFVQGSILQRRSISQDLFDDFVRFFNFSSGAYQESCPSPVGTTLVTPFNNNATSTEGYVARDDNLKQIIVAFRGSQQAQDAITDINIILLPYISPNVTYVSGAKAHAGFLIAYNSVASTVLSIVRSELAAHPDYELISTGHSLGGALASLGGASLAANFPDAKLRVFTYGQPRTGNSGYAQVVEDLVGTENLYRAVHTTDGVPTLIPTFLGYQHHVTEYWQFEDPATPDNVKQCSGREDPTCSASIPSQGINDAHDLYFGQQVGNPEVCG
ncbi:alpha beta-hydrolase [Pyrrhoderma noxium]|uniref:Alpha beta-hydrolase n=1 Tax=Pyrrhoderma noxium TaxID=2282107 RepID=A0A286U694_9AGAM|nr:alpha beta-hydrolase [Pyrrhoderma noxium]